MQARASLLGHECVEDSKGIAPSLPPCEGGIFLLDDEPRAAPTGIAPA